MRRGVVVAILFALGCFHDSTEPEDDDVDFSESVILCEDAVSHLARCCPGFQPHALQCDQHHHSTGGCDPTITDVSPALSVVESRCIHDLDCGALVDRGICARAQAATPYVQQTGSTEQCANYPDAGWFSNCQNEPYSTSNTHDPVCP